MKKLIFLTLTITLFYFSKDVLFAQPQNDILQKVDEIKAPGETFTFTLKLTEKKDDGDSEAEFSGRVKDSYKSLVIYNKPSSIKGRVLLMVKENMWIYIPGTRRPLRISPQQQIMGNVSNADVARVVYNLDYQLDSTQEDTFDGRTVLKLILNKKSDGAAYKSITLWVEKDTYKPIKADHYALSGKLLKTAYYKSYKEILGKERPTIIEIHDALNKSDVSIMEYIDIKIEDTPDSYFQKTFMDRIKY